MGLFGDLFDTAKGAVGLGNGNGKHKLGRAGLTGRIAKRTYQGKQVGHAVARLGRLEARRETRMQNRTTRR